MKKIYDFLKHELVRLVRFRGFELEYYEIKPNCVLTYYETGNIFVLFDILHKL